MTLTIMPHNNHFVFDVVILFSRLNPFHVRVYLDKLDTDGGVATGDLFWDDGVSIGKYNLTQNHCSYPATGQLFRDCWESEMEII